MGFIELKGITKNFNDGSGSRKVLDHLDLSLDKGDFVAVTGVSGAGKTTLLNILGTLLTPDEGSYFIDATDVLAPGTDLLRLRNRSIGFVFQDHRLLPQFTVMQNILLPALADSDATNPAIIEWGGQLVRTMGIENLAAQLPDTLSGGEKSRAAICRALIMKPDLLLADEPTGQLDSGHAREVAELLARVNRELGTTIVLVTHSDALAHSASRIYQLKEGKLS
ncbi:MAG: ABC transporter ATP-binding protein [Bacteroidaceae bacterium]|nr:ABC transporter ATP-binding protein [Bacteroidaceae bacterium]